LSIVAQRSVGDHGRYGSVQRAQGHARS
jgi:hypothetical protein